MTSLPPPLPPGPPPPPSTPASPWPPTPGAAPVRTTLGQRRSAGLVILLSVVTCGIWTIVWAYQNGDELQRWSGKGAGGIVHLIATFFVAPVTMFLLAGEVEQLYRDEGREPPITAVWGLWFLLPLIGNLVWYLRIQEAINDYWTMHGQTNEPSI